MTQYFFYWCRKIPSNFKTVINYGKNAYAISQYSNIDIRPMQTFLPCSQYWGWQKWIWISVSRKHSLKTIIKIQIVSCIHEHYTNHRRVNKHGICFAILNLLLLLKKLPCLHLLKFLELLSLCIGEILNKNHFVILIV